MHDVQTSADLVCERVLKGRRLSDIFGCCRVPSTCVPTGSGVGWPTRTASSRTKTSHRAAMVRSTRTGSLPAMARQTALALPMAMQERTAVFKTQQPMTTSAAAMQHEMHPSRSQTDICTCQARGKTQRMQAQALRPLSIGWRHQWVYALRSVVLARALCCNAAPSLRAFCMTVS
jgi:hypothetical protein